MNSLTNHACKGETIRSSQASILIMDVFRSLSSHSAIDSKK